MLLDVVGANLAQDLGANAVGIVTSEKTLPTAQKTPNFSTFSPCNPKLCSRIHI